MNSQINLRMPEKLLSSAKSYAQEYGYSNIQEFIKETIREKLYEEGEFSLFELKTLKKFKKLNDEHNLYDSEKELFSKLE